METETLTTEGRPAPTLAPTDSWHAARGEQVKLVAHSSPQSSTEVRLSLDELQAIVQAAYDQHGILAQPSYDTEAARA